VRTTPQAASSRSRAAQPAVGPPDPRSNAVKSLEQMSASASDRFADTRAGVGEPPPFTCQAPPPRPA